MHPIRRILIIAPRSCRITPAVERGMAVAKALHAQVWIGRFATPMRRLRRALETPHTRLYHLQDDIEARFGVTPQLIDDTRLSLPDRVAFHVARLGIDLVIKDAEPSSVLQRLVVIPLDWELVRASTVPVWLVRAAATPLPATLAATVDATHPEHGAGRLNDAIVDMATTLRDVAQAKLRVLSVFSDLPFDHYTKDPSGLGAERDRGAEHTQVREQHRAAFEALLRAHRLSPDDGDILCGPTRERLRRQIAAQPPDVLVLGTLRRTGLERLFMGSTTEHLMSRAQCDLLVVPLRAGHRTRVRARALARRRTRPRLRILPEPVGDDRA